MRPRHVREPTSHASIFTHLHPPLFPFATGNARTHYTARLPCLSVETRDITMPYRPKCRIEYKGTWREDGWQTKKSLLVYPPTGCVATVAVVLVLKTCTSQTARSDYGDAQSRFLNLEFLRAATLRSLLNTPSPRCTAPLVVESQFHCELACGYWCVGWHIAWACALQWVRGKRVTRLLYNEG